MVIPAPVIAEVSYLLGTRAGAQADTFLPAVIGGWHTSRP
jgi:hypothetical protein